MSQEIEIYKSESMFMKQSWFWRVRASNGKVVLDGGEAYFSKWNAKRAAKKQFPDTPIKYLT